MRAINHALTGAVIGLSVSQPAIALPLAFASHFVLDAVPHYGEINDDHTPAKFKRYLALDALACILLVVVLVLWQPQNWLQAAICAFLATSPDFMWLPSYIRELRHQEPVNLNLISRFHKKIQWFERPSGFVPEVIYFVGMCFVLFAVGNPI